jgi:hypothetical protein
MLVLVLPSQPIGTLALDGSLVGKAAGRRRSLCACDAAAQVRRPSCEPPTANAAPSLPVKPVRGRATTPPRTTAARRTHCAQRGRPAAPSHSRGQRGADNAAAEPRTPEARPSGHLDGTGRVDTGRPLDRSDGRPHGGQRTRTGRRPAWPASGHSSRPATTRWAARPRPGRSVWRRLATHDGSAVTTPAPRPWPPPLNNCAAPLSTPRLGALLSCVGLEGTRGGQWDYGKVGYGVGLVRRASAKCRSAWFMCW